MTTSKRHRVLIATDGSPPAQAAVATAVMFPWASETRARAILASPDWLRAGKVDARAALSRHHEIVSVTTKRALAKRWKNVDTTLLDEAPIAAILDEARRFEATLIALGWRGHGTFRRLLAGSVSRAVAAQAHCPVLVVRTAPKAVRRFVVGFDGCPNAERALDFLESLEPPSGGRAVLVNVVEPLSMPKSAAVIPKSTRAVVRHELDALNQERIDKARAIVDVGVARLARSGWSATGEVRTGSALERLLSAASEHQADVLVMGARAVSGIERALLGSVANGALNRSKVPVLLVR
jgi:nucleotide-binding universal stress UspA family protein